MYHQNEKQLNVLLDFSGKNNPREFSVNKFIREIRPANRDQHYRHLNQELMHKRETSVEGIALYCWQHQQAIFEAAYAANKIQTLYESTLDMNEVYAYVVDLFVDRTWLGFEKEYEAEAKLSKKLRPGTHVFTDARYDTDYSVDLCIRDAQQRIICAVQVKPTSYKYMSPTHHNVVNDKKKNDRFTWEYGLAVDYVYWDSKTRAWEDWSGFLKTVGERHQQYDQKAAA